MGNENRLYRASVNSTRMMESQKELCSNQPPMLLPSVSNKCSYLGCPRDGIFQPIAILTIRYCSQHVSEGRRYLGLGEEVAGAAGAASEGRRNNETQGEQEHQEHSAHASSRYRKRFPFYGVHRGFSTGVFDSWEETNKQTNGYSQPIFKGFMSHDAAALFVENGPNRATDNYHLSTRHPALIARLYNTRRGTYGSRGRN